MNSEKDFESLCVAIIGTRQTGKTTRGKECMQASERPKTLIVDTLDHPKYRQYPIVSLDRLKLHTKGVVRVKIYDNFDLLETIREDVRNTLIIFEDAGKYLTGTLPNNVKHVVYDSKQVKNDLVFMYHGFADAPPFILKNLNFLTLLKIGSEKIKKYEDKIPDYEDVYSIHQQIQASPDPYAHITIRVNG